MKNRIVAFANWAQANWLVLIVFMVVVMLLFVCMVMFSWLYGYWSNALCGTKFELNSCWTGIGAVISGLGGITALAKAAWTKYNTDSQFNTNQGELPNINNLKSEVMR
ncbi:hypothetical protein [Pelosinus sp. IPA-1]|uniref:hypothetical protein n=1 Tax=Pelosinus sp. IPA-1 TaxID=3029569 RepID=UPI0024362B6F|nr:hypothetical protein [Pelosinus sp. IPA-1]GMB01086.1 hypothetical protein PIPA1_38850 [Pelosinus sp. IPA-1]